MRWPGILIRVIGWLLTPLVVWAASFIGAWLLLQPAGYFDNPRHAILAALLAALAAGFTSLLLWLRLLRRSPRLRHSLHLDRQGLPVIADLVEPERTEDAKAVGASESEH